MGHHPLAQPRSVARDRTKLRSTQERDVIHDITGFLQSFPPFDAATEEELASLVQGMQIEFFAAGSFVLRAQDGLSQRVYVVRTGQAELLEGGRVVDVLEPGDVLGLPSALTNLPSGLDVRAAQDLLVYRVDAEAMVPLLSGRSGLQFVVEAARKGTTGWVADVDPTFPSSAALSDLARSSVVVEATASLRTVVRLMKQQDASSAIVTHSHRPLGILTDHDLRNRVVGVERDLDDPISSVMTGPVHSVRLDASTDEAALAMLTHGVKHLAVVATDGSLVGVVEEIDLLAAQAQVPFRLRRAIGRANDLDELTRLSGSLLPSTIQAHRSGHAPDRVAATHSVLVTTLLSRVIAILLAERTDPPAPFTWLVTGSAARAEMVPSSDLDSVVAWDGDDRDEEMRGWMLPFASDVLAVMSRCGVRSDTNGVRADDLRFARSAVAWGDAVHSFAADPTKGQGAVYLAALVDATPVWGAGVWAPVRDQIDAARQSRLVRQTLGQVATAHRPPTGFVKDLVIEANGEHRGTLDLKRGGLSPLVDIGRFLATVCESSRSDTLGRLEAAYSAGILLERDFLDLRAAFLFLMTIRLDHQTGLIAEGHEPDDHLAPSELAGITRRHLRDVLRLTARTQRQIAGGDLPRRR